MKITLDTQNALNKIASRTKMDCWFYLVVDENGDAYVHDCENNRKIALSTAVKQMHDGIIDTLAEYGLTVTEMAAVNQLFVTLGLPEIKCGNRFVYTVTIDWADDCDSDNTCYPFLDFDEARKFFDELVEDDKFDDFGGVYDESKNEEFVHENNTSVRGNGNGYEWEMYVNDKGFYRSWNIAQENEYLVSHSSITLTKKLLYEE